MKLVVTAVKPTPILWCRASALASPTQVPASTLPAREIAPVRANIASKSVVLPLWKGPTSAMHRGPRGLLTSCPIAASSCGARPVIGSATVYALPPSSIWQGRKSLRCIDQGIVPPPCHRKAADQQGVGLIVPDAVPGFPDRRRRSGRPGLAG